MKRLLLVWVFCGASAQDLAQVPTADDRVIPYTLADRDRGVRMEARLDALATETTRRADQTDAYLTAQQALMQTGFDRILNGIYWGTSLIAAILLFLVGFIFYDRKVAATASNSPLKQEIDLMKVLIQNQQAELNRLKAELKHD
jgi:hypothetical protein